MSPVASGAGCSGASERIGDARSRARPSGSAAGPMAGPRRRAIAATDRRLHRLRTPWDGARRHFRRRGSSKGSRTPRSGLQTDPRMRRKSPLHAFPKTGQWRTRRPGRRRGGRLAGRGLEGIEAVRGWCRYLCCTPPRAHIFDPKTGANAPCAGGQSRVRFQDAAAKKRRPAATPRSCTHTPRSGPHIDPRNGPLEGESGCAAVGFRTAWDPVLTRLGWTEIGVVETRSRVRACGRSVRVRPASCGLALRPIGRREPEASGRSPLRSPARGRAPGREASVGRVLLHALRFSPGVAGPRQPSMASTSGAGRTAP